MMSGTRKREAIDRLLKSVAPFPRFYGKYWLQLSELPPLGAGWLAKMKFLRKLWNTPFKTGEWNSALKHAERKGKTVLIWSMLNDKMDARQACLGLRDFFANKDYAPVLVTGIEDFTFYSRLGWLVEYLPENGNYRKNKIRYLALRYQDSPVIPVECGFFLREEFGKFWLQGYN